MSDISKQISDWQDKVRESFGEESRLYHYLFETLDNFYYRYLETTTDKNLKTKELAPHTWGVESYEPNLVEALKTQNINVRPGMIEMAKTIPRSENPKVKYSLFVNVRELTADQGELSIFSEINWDFPNFKKDSGKALLKRVDFNYVGVDQFRKQLALHLEDACEVFY